MKTLAGFRGNRSVLVVAVLLGAATFFSLPKPVHAATDCTAGRTLSVIAHPDDDLLFQNPDMIHDIRAGKCVQTVYLTAGDAGGDAQYIALRQDGVMAAYAQMAGEANRWKNSVQPEDGHPTEAFSLIGDPRITLRFLSLPDGNPNGSGYPVHGGESLEKLWNGTIPVITTLNGSGSYTKEGLVATLNAVMSEFQPNTIRTLNYTGGFGPNYQTHSPSWDHSDHLAAARFALAANQTYSSAPLNHTIVGYVGSGPGSETDVTGVDLSMKQAAFYRYSEFDSATNCADDEICLLKGGQYPRLLQRQYVAADHLWKAPAQHSGGALAPAQPAQNAQSGASPLSQATTTLNEGSSQQAAAESAMPSNLDAAEQVPASVANAPPDPDSDGFLQHVWASMRRD
jgi:LmbE family N-acetylglucosaminyl deacetylase